MAAVDFLHHEYLPTWAEVELATLDVLRPGERISTLVCDRHPLFHGRDPRVEDSTQPLPEALGSFLPFGPVKNFIPVLCLRLSEIGDAASTRHDVSRLEHNDVRVVST
ncbi:hypothetical protein TNCV_3252081 [Trichonephila clavipes]|nr:hypothetical protein TNCV_3252081 [Trichonephila clavipes]